MKNALLMPDDSMDKILREWSSYHRSLLARADSALNGNATDHNADVDPASGSRVSDRPESHHNGFSPESMALALALKDWEEANSRLTLLLNGPGSETEYDTKAHELARDLDGFNLAYDRGLDHKPLKRPELIFPYYRNLLINTTRTLLDGYSELLVSWLMFCKMRNDSEIPEASYVNRLYKVGDLLDREIMEVGKTYLGIDVLGLESHWAMA